MEPTQGRERILCIGSAGAGKSSTWCKVAHWLNVRESPNSMWVIDTDMAADRMKVGYKEAFDNKIKVYEPFEWQDYKTCLNDIFVKAKPNDWLVLDMAHKPWQSVQEYFSDEVFGQSIDNYFLEARKKAQGGNALDGWTDWSVINKLYNAWMMKFLRFPGHIIACAPVTNVINEGKKTDDAPEIKSIFGAFGVKPEGQKALPFQFHTVLLLSDGGKNGYRISTIKDREREKLKNQELVDFVPNYLVKVAGWKL